MDLDLTSTKFKNQYEKMSINSKSILSKLIVECDKKSLNHISTDTPDYRLFIELTG